MGKVTVFIWGNAFGLYSIALALSCDEDCEEALEEANQFLESLGTGPIVTWSESLKRMVLVSRMPLKLSEGELREIESRLRQRGWEVRLAKEADTDADVSNGTNGTNS